MPYYVNGDTNPKKRGERTIMTIKEQFLHDLNKAFANNDVDYLTKCVTDDIQWNIIGEDTIWGKMSFTKALTEMGGDENLFDLQIDDIIIHQDKAVVEGSMISRRGKTYAFCDIYTFANDEKPLIKEMSSYVITMRKKPLKV